MPNIQFINKQSTQHMNNQENKVNPKQCKCKTSNIYLLMEDVAEIT